MNLAEDIIWDEQMYHLNLKISLHTKGILPGP